MYEFKMAYRFTNGEVEGFIGHGISIAKSKEKCLEQIMRKCKIIEEDFIKENIINSFKKLSNIEITLVKNDFNNNLKY